MAKFLATLVLVVTTTRAMNTFGSGHGYSAGVAADLSGFGKQISTFGHSPVIGGAGMAYDPSLSGVSGPPYSGISQVSPFTSSGLGGYYSSMDSVGANKQSLSPIALQHGFGTLNGVSTGIGHHQQHAYAGPGGISSVGLHQHAHAYAGPGGVASSVGQHHHQQHQIGGHSLAAINSFNRLSSVSSIPGGYYGGLLAYPMSVGSAVSAKQLHIPGSAVDTYKGYFGGYYPGSIGYGQSYRFFH